MANGQPKLAYTSANFRIRCEFTKDLTTQLPVPPEDLLSRANRKLEAEKKSGVIDYFRIFESRLTRVWNNLRRSSLPPDYSVDVVLAAGCPAMSGFDVRKSSVAGELGLLSITTSIDQAIHWDVLMVELRLAQILESLGIRAQVDGAQIHRILLHAQAGRTIDREILLPAPMMPVDVHTKPYRIASIGKHTDLQLLVYDLKATSQPETWKTLLTELSREAKKLERRADDEIELLKDDLVKAVRSGLKGPQRFGLELPLSLLVAVEQELLPKNLGMIWRGKKYRDLKRQLRVPVSASKNVPTQQRRKPVQPGGIDFTFHVAEDRMRVTVLALDLGRMKVSDVTYELLLKELSLLGVKFGCQQHHHQTLIQALSTSNVKDLVVAEGRALQHGSGAYLAPTFGERSNQGSFRDRQQKKIVRRGDEIAAIRYKVPPIDGCDVFGTIEQATTPSPPQVEIGKGVELRDELHYYATFDGVPVVESEANKIKVVSGYMHEGDVNLVTGNIIMKGDVEINGSVQAGARIEVEGNLVIKGSIAEAFVSCTGDLDVGLGVISGGVGYVRCKGNMKAEFIENAVVYVGGRLKVEKAIISSSVFCKNTIRVASESGIISGGLVSSLKRVTANSIGRDGGTVTQVYAGTDWLWYRSIEVPERRLEKLSELRRQRKSDLRTFSKSSSGDPDKVGLVEDQVKRLEAVIKTLQDRLEKRKSSQPNHDFSASIRCPGKVSANVQLSIGGQKLSVTETAEKVAIIFKKKTGPRIVPLDEAKNHMDEGSPEDDDQAA